MRPLHPDGVRQRAVQPAHPGLLTALHRGVNMHHLLHCMHTRIGSASTDRHAGTTDKMVQRLLQGVLDGLSARRGLPVTVEAALVTQTQGYSGMAFRKI